MISDPVIVFIVLALIVWGSVWLEERVRLVRYLSAVLTAILVAALFANIGLLPSASPTYGALGGVGVEVGIALVLLGVDARSVIAAGPAMLLAFALGAAGTALGSLVGAWWLADVVGTETWKLAGQYAGTYTGGSVNFVAVGHAVETSPDVYSAAIAADNVTTSLWMAACLVLPQLLSRWWPKRPETGGAPANHEDGVVFTQTERPVKLSDLVAVFGVALAAIWGARSLGSVIPAVPVVLWLTTFALILAQLPFVRRLSGAPVLGNYAMLLFLATIGAQSIFSEIVRVGVAIFYFTVVVVGVHGLVVFGIGRLTRLDLATLVVASQANVGGPASALAIATAKDYPDRVVPGVAVGLLGYAVGTYSGLAVAQIAHGLFMG